MVKIRLKSFIIGIVFALFAISLIGAASAAGSKLLITKVDAKVGGKSSKNIGDKATISREAKPGDNIEFTVETMSNFTSSENVDIEDVSVEATIENIDDGDDLEQESSEFDLRPGRDKKVALKFAIPVEVEEDSFDVRLIAEGRDENGTTHKREYTIVLDVDKERDDVRINKKLLSPTEVSCSRKGVQLTAGVINAGSDEEKGITLTAVNQDLGLNFKDTFNLDEGAFDDSIKFTKAYTFNVADSLAAGTYPIKIKATFEDSTKFVEDTVNLIVNECAKTATTTTTATTLPAKETKESTESAREKEIVEVIGPTTFVATTPTIGETGTALQSTVERSFFSNRWLIGILIGAEIIAAIVIIGLMIYFAKK